MRYLRKLAMLGAVEQALLLRALGTLLAARVGLYLVPFPRLKSWSETAHRAPKTPQSPAQIGLAIARASRFVPRSTCLVQALAAQRLLRRQNYASSLHVGVKPGGGGLMAHAWVECEGETVVGGQESAQYTPLLRAENAELETL